MNKAKIEVLETERLLLRPLTVEDAEAVLAWASDERVTRYMAYSGYSDIKIAEAWLAAREEDSEYTWGIVIKESGILIGTGAVGVEVTEDGYWGLGYNIRYDCWNHGYTTEAMKAIMKYAYDALGVRKFCAQHALENPASGRVIEKLGLKFSRFSEYSKLDGSKTFKSKYYTLELD